MLLGAALAGAGFRLALVEPASPAAIKSAEPDGRALALLAGSVGIAERLGVWPHLAPHGAPVWRTEVKEAVTGGRVVYDAEDGTAFGYGFEHAVLRQALLRAFLATAGEAALVQGELTALRRDPASATLDLTDGRHITAKLVVGADGRRSRVRDLARIRARSWAYDQSAVALVVAHARPHGHVVREWLRPEGPLALLPLPGDRTGITWVSPPEAAGSLAAALRPDLLAALTAATADALGPLALESGPTLYPLGALHAERYVAPRLALVGDAAHGVHPIHAQGFNMGVADVGALVDALTAARARGLDVGSADALLPYARARQMANEGRLLMTDALNRVFSNDLAPLAQVRGIALSALDRVGPLKRLAVRHGMQVG